ncbi:hypothetical protein Tco_1435680, partial [Tanacetum coccineum]
VCVKPNPESSGWIEVLEIHLAASSEFLLLLSENLTESSDFVSLVLIVGIPESWPKLLEALNLDEYEVKRSAVA